MKVALLRALTQSPPCEVASGQTSCHRLQVVIVVEAAGVELFRVLKTRNLLILGTATTAKKAPLPDSLYVYCTKVLWLWNSADTH
jgi:hypothetical protein